MNATNPADFVLFPTLYGIQRREQRNCDEEAYKQQDSGPRKGNRRRMNLHGKS